MEQRAPCQPLSPPERELSQLAARRQAKELRITHRSASIGCWALDVRCWMFRLCLPRFPFAILVLGHLPPPFYEHPTPRHQTIRHATSQRPARARPPARAGDARHGRNPAGPHARQFLRLRQPAVPLAAPQKNRTAQLPPENRPPREQPATAADQFHRHRQHARHLRRHASIRPQFRPRPSHSRAPFPARAQR